MGGSSGQTTGGWSGSSEGGGQGLGGADECATCFFFSSRRRHTRCSRDWSSDVCSSDLSWERLPFKERDFLKKEVGSTKLSGESKYSVLERLWARPTFEVHGIAGGFTGDRKSVV